MEYEKKNRTYLSELCPEGKLKSGVKGQHGLRGYTDADM